jgi:hypothetical protein
LRKEKDDEDSRDDKGYETFRKKWQKIRKKMGIDENEGEEK